jgi:hypothetical protein
LSKSLLVLALVLVGDGAGDEQAEKIGRVYGVPRETGFVTLKISCMVRRSEEVVGGTELATAVRPRSDAQAEKLRFHQSCG